MKIELRDILVHLPVTGKTLFRLKHFAVESGQRVLIQGESGKGKTTLLHLMAGLFFPSEGYVELGSQRLNNLNDEERCQFRRENIGIIFQKLNLIEHLTALENIELAVGLKGEARALKALKDVGLEGHGKERSSVLSLGEQQRVAVARVLAADVKLILADEPTSSLDQRNSGKIIDLLFEAAKGKTLVVVSHDHRIEDKFDHVLQFENLIQPGTGGR